MLKFAYAFYLGCSLSMFADVHYYDWQIWAIGAPVVLMVIFINER